MGVQAETWGWALGQPMGLRWGVQSVDWASKTRGRAPVGRCAWRFPGDTPEFEFRRVASFEIYATLSTSATLIPSLEYREYIVLLYSAGNARKELARREAHDARVRRCAACSSEPTTKAVLFADSPATRM
jgi:hypothetical protein